MCNCDEACESCSCEPNKETLTELLARLMFDSNITVEDFSKKAQIPVKHIEAILSQDSDNIDTECLFSSFMENYRPVFAKMV